VNENEIEKRGYRKVTDEEILEALENKTASDTMLDVAQRLGFMSGSGLANRIKRMHIKIKDRAKEILNEYAVQATADLKAQSKAGKTEATKIILEITDTYIPKSKQDVKMDVTGLAQRMRKAETRVTEQKDKTDSEPNNTTE